MCGKRGRRHLLPANSIVEPDFGKIGTCQVGKALLLRGLERAEAEWHLLLVGRNSRKLFGFGGIAVLAGT
jgi:hypothetical protein